MLGTKLLIFACILLMVATAMFMAPPAARVFIPFSFLLPGYVGMFLAARRSGF